MSDVVLEKYKVCPICGAHNDPSFFECAECGGDIFSERTVDAKTEQRAQTVPDTAAQPLYRYCDCGAQNLPQARKCAVCGEDISDVQPRPAVQEKQMALSSIDGQTAFVIPKGETILGREGTLKEYLTGKPFVSRQQARVTRNGDTLTIENLSATNYTFVNNVRIEPGATELHDGDEVGLGGICVEGKRQNGAAYFIVRIGSCI